MSSQPWSIEEIEVAVAEYFAMLRAELSGRDYVKREHNDRARRLLVNRSRASVEYKFRNISAVLINHDHAYVCGYLPAQSYQAELETAVLEWLDAESDLSEVVRSQPQSEPLSLGAGARFSDVLVEPPDQQHAARPRTRVRPMKLDFVRLDAENRRLGVAGESFVFELEQRRLHEDAQRRDLARRVRWVARDDGDGLGYDIASFEASGVPRLIEVKTTRAGKYLPFSVARNELAVSRERGERYYLYRLFEFGHAPHLYMLCGPLDATCALEAATFRARVSSGATGQ